MPTAGALVMADGASTVARLVTLGNWSFTGIAATAGFYAEASQLSTGTLQRPPQPGTGAGPVADALGMGYAALTHILRDGSVTASWYRGPLAPLPVPVFTQWPANAASADTLLRYDPTTGLFDTSYSSAWMAGFLLALHDPAFSAAMGRLAVAAGQSLAGAAEQQALADACGQIGGGQSGPGSLSQQVALKLADALNGGGQGGAGGVGTLGVGRDALKSALGQHESPVVAALIAGPDGTLAANWLAALSLLQGIAPQWLIPDPAMLPVESIRFFTLDPNWVTAALDGATSLVGSMVTGASLAGALVQQALANRGALYAQAMGSPP